MESFGTGSGGTIVGSATGSGGAGGRVGEVEAVFSGGGAGLVIGGAFFPHAAAVSPHNKKTDTAERIVIVCSCRSG
jgi:hypothetical protein